jgi:hypothetical protein
MTCDLCGGVLHSFRETEVFPYGSGADRVLLRATVTAYVCQDCAFQFTSSTAEAARQAAVDAFLIYERTGMWHMSRSGTRRRRLRRKWRAQTIWMRADKLKPLVFPRFRKGGAWTNP